MKMQTEGSSVQARVVSLRYAHGVTSGEIAVRSFDDGPEWTVPVTIGKCPQRKGASIVQAVSRLLCGAMVMDGADILAIRDSLDNARGLATELAPEHAAATLAIAAIEATRDRLAPVTSFDDAFAPAPAFLEGLAS
jgi:hypothetical protein